MIKYEIEFISYNGEYPNLCSGELIIKVNNKIYKFDYLLESGGSVSFTDDWNSIVSCDLWKLSQRNKQLKELNEIYGKTFEDDLLRIVNKFVPLGCCGGCV